MQIKELGHVVLYVKDVNRSISFYRDVLGFRMIASGAAHCAVLFRAYASRIAAHRNRARSRPEKKLQRIVSYRLQDRGYSGRTERGVGGTKESGRYHCRRNGSSRHEKPLYSRSRWERVGAVRRSKRRLENRSYDHPRAPATFGIIKLPLRGGWGWWPRQDSNLRHPV